MSTSFLVIQAQRDFAQAKNNELAAQLAYDLSLVDFEALQEAPPSVSASVSFSAPDGRDQRPLERSRQTSAVVKCASCRAQKPAHV